MGYSDNAYFKLVDGYQLDSADGYSFTSAWVDCRSFPMFDVSVVFGTASAGTIGGTVKLQKSNDLQFTGGNQVLRLYDGNGQTPGTSAPVNDAADCPTGQGAVSVSVSGAGVYSLNQYNVGYHWFRVVYTSSSDASCQLDIFVSMKKI